MTAASIGLHTSRVCRTTGGTYRLSRGCDVARWSARHSAQPVGSPLVHVLSSGLGQLRERRDAAHKQYTQWNPGQMTFLEDNDGNMTARKEMEE